MTVLQNRAAGRVSGPRRRFHTLQDNRVAYIYILPWVVGLLLLQLYPFIASFVYSFTNYSIVKETSFLGLDNYVRSFTRDRTFWISLRATGIYVLFSVPLKLAFALFIAILLNMRVRGIKLFRMLYYLPSILGGSVGIAIMWRYLFNRHGYVNLLLSYLGVGAVDFLGSKDIAIYTISMLSVWQFGSAMILFLSALKNVPNELVEAAKIDGANKAQVFTKITLKLITPTIFFNVIMQTISAFQQFAAPYNITGGGPVRSTYLYGLMLYENAFTYQRMGYACAQSWILFVIVLIFTALIFKSSPYWAFYSDGGMF